MSTRPVLFVAFLLFICSSALHAQATPATAAHVVRNPASTTMVPAREVKRIGVVDGDSAYQFFQVSGVHIDPKGTYHVGMEFQVRVYDANGKFVKSIGRHGKGPGEFNYPPQMWFAGDTMVAIDRNLMRASSFNAAGKLLDTYNEWSHPHKTIHPIGRAGTSWIAAVDLDGKEDGPDDIPVDVKGITLKPGEMGERRPVELHRYYPRNDSIGPLVVAVRNQKLIGVEKSKENQLGFTIRPLDDEPAYTMDERGYIYAKVPTEYRIDVFDPRGKQVMTIRRDYAPIPITTADLDGMPQLMVENASRSMKVMQGTVEAAQARMLQSFTRQVDAMKKMPLPATRFPLGRMLASPNGMLWVERADYMKPGVRQAMKSGPTRVATRWDLFDNAGRYLGTTDLPLGFRAQSVTDDGRVAGVLKDDDDVEFVVVYQVQKARTRG